MKLAQKQGDTIARNNVIELLNVTPSQAYRLLKKQTDKEKLRLVESGRNAYYGIV